MFNFFFLNFWQNFLDPTLQLPRRTFFHKGHQEHWLLPLGLLF